MKRRVEIFTSVCSTLAAAGFVLATNVWAQTSAADGSTQADGSAQRDPLPAKAAPPAAPLPAAPGTRLKVSFKLDSRLSGPTYGGEHWVSPLTYTGASAQDIVQAKVEGIGPQGQPVRISPKWTASDPEMVAVSPSEGSAVKITVKRAGESTLEVASHGVSRSLSIKAEQKNNFLQVQLSQTR